MDCVGGDSLQPPTQLGDDEDDEALQGQAVALIGFVWDLRVNEVCVGATEGVWVYA